MRFTENSFAEAGLARTSGRVLDTVQSPNADERAAELNR
jgi:hypothetical protein